MTLLQGNHFKLENIKSNIKNAFDIWMLQDEFYFITNMKQETTLLIYKKDFPIWRMLLFNIYGPYFHYFNVSYCCCIVHWRFMRLMFFCFHCLKGGAILHYLSQHCFIQFLIKLKLSLLDWCILFRVR